MYRYTAFGLNIESELLLPGVQQGGAERYPTVKIRQARPDFDWAGLMDYHDAGDFLVAHLVDGSLLYWLEKGQSITFLPKDSCPDELAEFLMQSMATGFALALLLRQRGYLVLHATILQNEKHTIGFLGGSGWGKSTLAEFFSQHGYRVLSDDIGALEVTEDNICALQGLPLVKLRPESAQWLLSTSNSPSPVLDGRVYLTKSDQAHSNQDNFAASMLRAPLDALFLLEEDFTNAVSVEHISSKELTVELLRHVHGGHLLKRADYQSNLLDQCSEVAGRIPTRVVQRKKGLEYLPLIKDIVEKSMHNSSMQDMGTATDEV